MPCTTSGTPTLYYETAGDPADEPLVLIEGLGAQLIGWRDGFVDLLAEKGLFVIRLDNRDVGLSEKMGGPGDDDAGYDIEDLADDVCRVLDAVGAHSAHIVGQSMGGLVAQSLALARPERVRSLVLFYTAPSLDHRFLTDETMRDALPSLPAEGLDRDQAIDVALSRAELGRSSGYAFDETWARELAGRSFDRCFRPDGAARQMAAVLRSADRTADLQQLDCPTAIIHGRADKLIRAEAAIELARLITDSEVHIYPGLGHQIAPPLWEEFVNIIERTIARARSRPAFGKAA